MTWTKIEDKITDTVFDKSTLMTLYALIRKGAIDLLYGVIKTGKESNVYLGKDKNGDNVAVKIHRIGTGDYRSMLDYIEGDLRFKGIKKSKRSIVYIWVKKEFKNLKRAKDCGVRVPDPIAFKNNVLVMEFIGEYDIASPMLKDVRLNDPRKVFETIQSYMKKLYNDGNLVHGDLSEYNILMRNDVPVIIDISQGVIREHPRAEEFLKRDVSNVCRFFSKFFEVDEKEVFEFIRCR
jgi:RIO kinase 1